MVLLGLRYAHTKVRDAAMVLPNLPMESSMNSKAVISAIMAMSLASASVAFAEGRESRNDRGRNEQAQRGDRQDRRGDEARQSERGEQRGRANGDDERRHERGAGPNHEFHRGERLPVEYRSRQFVVDDWRGHHLSAPPRGYHWVQTGGDYVLVAIATGVILQLLLGR